MKTSTLGLLTAGVLLAAQITQSQASDSKAGSNGRYEGVTASESSVWVIDTRTGRVRKCTQEFADQTPVCSKMSN